MDKIWSVVNLAKSFVLGGSGIQLYLIIGGLVASLLGGTIFYIKHLHSSIDTYKKNEVKLNVAIKSEKAHVKRLKKKIVRANKIVRKTRKELQESRNIVIDMRKKFAKTDIKKVGDDTPEVLEKKINNATKRVLDCFESLSQNKDCK